MGEIAFDILPALDMFGCILVVFYLLLLYFIVFCCILVRNMMYLAVSSSHCIEMQRSEKNQYCHDTN